jgi:hypothetical protein
MGMEYKIYEGKRSTLENVVDEALRVLLGTRCMTSAKLAIGSTKSNVASGAFDYCVDGIAYSKGAVAAGTAFTDLTVQPVSSTWDYLVLIDKAGTITILRDTIPVVPTGQKPSERRLPPVPEDKVLMGVVTITTNGSTTFTPGTTLLDAAGVTAVYTNTALPVRSVA